MMQEILRRGKRLGTCPYTTGQHLPGEQEQICDEFLRVACCTGSLREHKGLLPTRGVRYNQTNDEVALLNSVLEQCSPLWHIKFILKLHKCEYD